jgi:hypothetical protein
MPKRDTLIVMLKQSFVNWQLHHPTSLREPPESTRRPRSKKLATNIDSRKDTAKEERHEVQESGNEKLHLDASRKHKRFASCGEAHITFTTPRREPLQTHTHTHTHKKTM